MKKILFTFLLFSTLDGNSQSVFGYWYGNANVKSNNSANNYLVEMVLQPEKNYVKGILNYYFKNTYRSVKVQGNYNSTTRLLSLYNIPVTYHGSIANFEVDCNMNLLATLRVSKLSSNLVGSFRSLPDYRYTCPDINFDLVMNADVSKKDSVLKAISEYKESFQVWQPSVADSLVAVNIVPRKVINYVVEEDFKKRQKEVINEIEVESDSLRLDVYDNGEVDGDIISVFYNDGLILNSQKLTHKSIRIDVVLDSSKEYNEVSMYAENLGLIPPNTALIIVNDGKNKFNLRLSSNLEKSATIRIRRKKTIN